MFEPTVFTSTMGQWGKRDLNIGQYVKTFYGKCAEKVNLLFTNAK